jgi:hypothetical protein
MPPARRRAGFRSRETQLKRCIYFKFFLTPDIHGTVEPP